jgi:uncharacterized protein
VTADPREGLDADGFLVTGADPANIGPPYDAVVADVRHAVTQALGDELHSLYLYGSVATGQAAAPTSDLDVAAIVTSPTGRDLCRELSEKLGQRHRSVVREVGISAGLLAEVLADTDAGRAERCFLRHYCVHLSGADLREKLPRCRPDRALAREFIGDLAGTLERLRSALADPARSPEEVGVAAARRLLLAAAVLYSSVSGRWSTDRATGARMLADHHRAHASAADTAVRWSALVPGGPVAERIDAGAVTRLLDGPGAQLVADVARHLR